MGESKSLKYRALILLKESLATDRQLARELGVSVPWVRMFRNGDIQSPNVDAVQRLYEHLSGTTLFKD